MKKTIVLLLGGLLIGVLGSWAVIKVIIPEWNKSAVDNTYWEVTRNLDQGGEVFGYVHAEKITEAFLGFLTGMQKKIAAMSMAKPEAAQTFVMLNSMFKGYGLEEISGVGFSSIAVKPGLHRCRVVIHHRPLRNQGLLWNVTGPDSRYLDEFDLLPADTVLAFVSDYNIEKVAAWFGKQGQQMGGDRMSQGLVMIQPALQMAGVDLNRLLKSYGGRLGFLLTFDPEKRVTMPLKGSSISFPEPGFALLIAVRDSYIFDLCKSKLAALGQAQIKEESEVKKILFPRMPSPFPLEPAVAQKGDWLLVASMSSLVNGVFAADSRKRLSESAEFEKIAYRLPRRGNGIGYMSPAFLRLIGQLLRENKAVFKLPAAMEKLTAILERDNGFCQVMENSSSGLVYTMNHTFELATLFDVIETFIDIAKEKMAVAAPPPVGGAVQAPEQQ